MNNKLFRLAILFLYVLTTNAVAADYVSSVNAYQEGKNIVITYQLSERSNISVYVSTDGGKNFSSLKNISGDFGKNISSGTKQIIWNVLAEYDKFTFSEVCFKVVSFNAEAVKNNGHAYVDLGLPSGTLWATCNVGATKPEGYGDYFAWGETKPKYVYSRYDYKWYKVIDSHFEEVTKYCINCRKGIKDYKSILELSDDAANVNWGGDWCMPTRENLSELNTECTWDWTKKNGVEGYTVTGPNGNSIFLPVKESGKYWSSSHNMGFEDHADYIHVSSSIVKVLFDNCFDGLSVRPVLRVGFTYDIIFDSNGGEGTMPPIAINHAEVLTIPENTFTRSGYEFIGWGTKADGTGTRYEDEGKISVGDNITLYAQWYKNETDITHEYVDLGLPSGTVWATMNIGAQSPEDAGYFFAWGENKPKANYDNKTYKLDKSSYFNQTKDVDKKGVLKLEDDAAHVNWGGNWRMPSKEECEELISECIWTKTTQNGVTGYKIISKINGKSFFLPLWNGAYDQMHAKNHGGYIWTRSYFCGGYNTKTYFMNIHNITVKDGVEYTGYPVRPVMSRKSGKSYRSK